MPNRNTILTRQIVLITVVIAIIVVAVFVFFSKPNKPADNSSTGNNTATTGTNTQNPSSLISGMPGSQTVKVEKVVGQKIFFMTQGKEQSITIASSTKLVQQINDKGIFKDVEIKLSDITPSQIIEIIPDSSGTTAKSIRVLR